MNMWQASNGSRVGTHLPYCVILVLTDEGIVACGLGEGVWQAYLGWPPQRLHAVVVHHLSQEHLPGCMVLLHASAHYYLLV